MKEQESDSLAEQQELCKWLRRVTDEAIAARTKGIEFHGLEEDLRNFQSAILDSYNRTKPIKHPRDKGNHREEILRHFLTRNGLIPNSIRVPSVSTRVVSPSGQISPELDILFVNASDSIVLKRYENTLEYYPVESVLGTIQVKSRLTKKELEGGLRHIQSFKDIRPTRSLRRQMGGFTLEEGIYRRFGILFAYEGVLRWEKMSDIIREHLAECPNSLWPNMIVVLDRGYFLIGDKSHNAWDQRTLEDISNPEIHGFPDYSGHCLQQFYSYLVALLKQANTGWPNTNDYLRMPVVVGEHSLVFAHGAFSEYEKCPQHGNYLKKIRAEKIEEILDKTQNSEPMNWIKALDLAVGRSGTDSERYAKQPGDVFVYDPDGLGLENLLLSKEGFITCEQVVIDGRQYWLPWHYVVSHKLIDPCPQCRDTAENAKS